MFTRNATVPIKISNFLSIQAIYNTLTILLEGSKKSTYATFENYITG